ncbi:deoxyguanosinetriphosphate triphosphohydrolase [Mesorhizobium sp. M7A.F.Ca.CA.001.09.2.1]|uniref:Deoxyguanosinetriphosphate triphosphohydrolase-like protein n=4 Tax=Mesorhizobium TaxID=68287 RepID=A0AB38T552_9HYPH|nr:MULTISPECIES: deoxyguanosinetriphosphate triphosphohydrolase [Mesorhizobium]RUY30353.1 deoxyguanosinetriphosphate triphosphohydrolase [Mesorhizobium sp. M7A.F.Ca.CA.001.13.2.1]AMX93240.1 deoxyguanosinetriphosphate triphosphohydrolase [Mesorhizobium ciceri]MBZ9721531.1 deoxyguanosinetriphosphate triphosphohydrolase [Mesorhizobium sp. AD1-1]MBZ9891468.1 deoxyguanosinetriphosphate triphosphohydrolase [Mesorhizobium sp. BR1-1-3]MDF3207907.1 deoxyguanosinetriphosphate triphosphohydrolase [Mesorh
MTSELGDIGFGYRPRAAYACDPANSRGRLFDEVESPTRTPFQRDRDRIIHSTAFRRLKHKTQVFIAHEGDHYRTRLTHSIEVAQIARALARALRGDEDLAEAVALVHDFGHTPFGHTGEDALNEKMAVWGGFDHNAQSLRIVTRLEARYAEFDGLNLTWETLEGLVKHNGPLTDANGKGLKGPVPQAIRDYSQLHDLELDRFAGIEAQCAAIADDIAYNTHDIDDGLRAGLLTLDMLETVSLPGTILKGVRERYPSLDAVRTGHELMRRQITAMVEDVIRSTTANLDRIRPPSADAVRAAGETMVVFSAEMAALEKELKAFLYKHLYRHAEVMRVRADAEQIVKDLFDAYFADPRAMPDGWREGLDRADDRIKARSVADFLAGMTDTYALKEHRRLFDHTPELG